MSIINSDQIRGGLLPPQHNPGDILISKDGITAIFIQPISTSDSGWLSNEYGELLYEGV